MTHCLENSTAEDANGFERTRSLGDGIEREVITAIFEEYIRGGPQWITLHDDGHGTLTTTLSMNSSRFIPPARLHAMSIFGAITALCLIRGMSAFPIDPVLLHYFVHNCDLHSIHPALLAEWHPTLKQTLLEWITLGPQGDASVFRGTFASYCDLQVCSHDQLRTQVSNFSFRSPPCKIVMKRLITCGLQRFFTEP
jgi:hypothetical protein